MGYDRGDSFPFDFEPNGIKFGSKLKGKLSPRSYPIQLERKWNTSFLSASCRGASVSVRVIGVDFPARRLNLVFRVKFWERFRKTFFEKNIFRSVFLDTKKKLFSIIFVQYKKNVSINKNVHKQNTLETFRQF